MSWSARMLSQIKFWLFGAVLAVAIFLVLDGTYGNRQVAIGLAMAAAAIGAMSLGSMWDVKKDAEDEATYNKLARDEKARQAYLDVAAKGAKQIEGPTQDNGKPFEPSNR